MIHHSNAQHEDDNERIYETVPLKLPEGWRPDLNCSARSKTGRVTTFDALPANRNSDYCGVLLLKGDDDMATRNVISSTNKSRTKSADCPPIKPRLWSNVYTNSASDGSDELTI